MKKNFIFLFLAFIVLSGFRHTGPLTEYPINPEKTKKFYATQFTGSKKVNLINAQLSTTEFLIARERQGSKVLITTNIEDSLYIPDSASRGPAVEEDSNELVGNLKSWTETAISLLKTELEKKGFVASGEAEKRLELSITPKIDMIPAAFLSRCIVFLKVTTGDGYSREYEGNNMSVDSLANIFGGAVGLAVEELLNDNEILVYLGAPKKTPTLSSEKGMGSPGDKIEKEKRKAWSVAEVAESFGVPESTVRRWIVDRELRATKLGSTWLIPNSEVERISNPSKQTSSENKSSAKNAESPQTYSGEWLRKMQHLKAIGLLSQEEYAEEEARLRKTR